MESEKQQVGDHLMKEQQNGNEGKGIMPVQVMTDEQVEMLRKQIAVYAILCDQLSSTHHHLSGVRQGSGYCSQLMVSSGHKISPRQRWAPTPEQLQVLERIFDQGNGTPSKQKIKDIASELSQHGQISETNVYNWFQNRRARAKRRQSVSVFKDAESQIDKVDSSKEKTENEKHFQSEEVPILMAKDLCLQSPEISSELHSVEALSNKAEATFPSVNELKPSKSHLSFYDGILSNPGIDQLMERIEVQGHFDPYQRADDYSTVR